MTVRQTTSICLPSKNIALGEVLRTWLELTSWKNGTVLFRLVQTPFLQLWYMKTWATQIHFLSLSSVFLLGLSSSLLSLFAILSHFFLWLCGNTTSACIVNFIFNFFLAIYTCTHVLNLYICFSSGLAENLKEWVQIFWNYSLHYLFFNKNSANKESQMLYIVLVYNTSTLRIVCLLLQ